MRALRVVGLGEDGKIVILESDRGERFQVPADERLRAAARGDITRLGQIAIELESQMRPREIQSRIRAGESVEQVAAAAGVPPEKVERFAYPVLLERSRTAELAQRAHPVREDGPDVQELGEVVAQAFGARGQDYTAAVWDSWKGEDGKWVVQLTWTAGRSNNHAHWSFHPGAHGGTVTPLDDHALDLLDPNPNRGLRTVRPVTELAAQALQVAEPRRQAVNGGEPPRRVEEQDFVQDFELTDEMASSRHCRSRTRRPLRPPARAATARSLPEDPTGSTRRNQAGPRLPQDPYRADRRHPQEPRPGRPRPGAAPERPRPETRRHASRRTGNRRPRSRSTRGRRPGNGSTRGRRARSGARSRRPRSRGTRGGRSGSGGWEAAAPEQARSRCTRSRSTRGRSPGNRRAARQPHGRQPASRSRGPGRPEKEPPGRQPPRKLQPRRQPPRNAAEAQQGRRTRGCRQGDCREGRRRAGRRQGSSRARGSHSGSRRSRS